MRFYEVHNLREGGKSGNWLEYWEKTTRTKANRCHKIGCTRPATDGAHVQLDNPNDIEKLIERFEEDEDVTNVFHNMKGEEE